MFCPSCAAPNPPEARHCVSCGSLLPQAPTSAAPTGAPGEVTIAGRRIAGLGDRLIATILDTIFIAAAFAVIGMWAAVRWGGVTESGFSVEGKAALVAFAATGCFAFLYLWLLEGVLGATLGKLLIGIQVRDSYGAPCKLGASLIRNVLRLIDGLAVYLVGFLFAIFSRLRQRLGDRLANTVVVQSGAGASVRAVALLFWLGGIVGGVWGAYTIHRGAPSGTPVATVPAGGASSSSSQTVAKTVGETLVLTSGEFKLSYSWRDGSKDGPVRPPGPYNPGDTVYLAYELTGFGTAPDGRADLTLEFTPTDPSGMTLYQPRTISFTQGGTASGSYWFQLHRFVQTGTHQLVIKVRDAVKNREATQGAPFDVQAPPIAPATALEVRNFHYSASKDGPVLEPPAFAVGETVHYGFDLFGQRFQQDRGSWQIAFQLIGPDGKVLLDRPDWDTTTEDFAYHPPAFFVHYSGYVTLPADVARGAYVVKLLATDRIAGASVTHEARFQVR